VDTGVAPLVAVVGLAEIEMGIETDEHVGIDCVDSR
jgi:hypothetical protein